MVKFGHGDYHLTVESTPDFYIRKQSPIVYLTEFCYVRYVFNLYKNTFDNISIFNYDNSGLNYGKRDVH